MVIHVATSSRNGPIACAPAGALLIAVGAWVAAVPAALGLLDPMTPTVATALLPGAVAALAGALILRGRPRAILGCGLAAVAAGLWFAVGSLDHVLGAAATVALPEWLVFFFLPSMLLMVLGVHVLEVVDVPVEDRGVSARGAMVRARDPHRRIGADGPHRADRRAGHPPSRRRRVPRDA
jgi:hypothetical protein